MADWDQHIITVVGPIEDIARFAEAFNIVSGAIDVAIGEIVDNPTAEPPRRPCG
jgi:hypothetical protein